MLPVSIIIPTYNYSYFIAKAIDSVLAQDYLQSLIQIIVVDDGSTDNTREVLNDYIISNKIEYYFQDNKGKASATVLGILKARGDIIFNLDADDEFNPKKVSTTVSVFEKFPDVVLVSSPAKIIFKGNSSIEPIPKFLIGSENPGDSVISYFLENNVLFGGGSTFSARSSTLKYITIPADADMYIDELLVFSTLLYGNVYFIPNPLSVWNIHGSNYSGSNDDHNIVLNKMSRMIKSSVAVLNFLKNQHISDNLINLYHLKHKIRVIFFKEQIFKKQYSDIFELLKFLVNTNSISFKTMYNYNAFQRLLPTKILISFKTLLRKS